MLEITRDKFTCAMSAQDTPAATMQPGEEVSFETYDCYYAKLLPEGATFADLDRRFDNPATGPLYIEGAEPGDTLKIFIKDIQLGKIGILDKGLTSGALKSCYQETTIKKMPVKDGYIHYSDKVKIPVKPMIGVIGTAPAEDAVSTVTPMDHGGNMDCTKIEKGATLYLPVFVKGGLLSTGDFHAIMGDGEVGNCGVEIEGKATFQIDVLKQTGITYPMIENPTQWITIAYGETLDEASDKAVMQMYRFLREKKNLSDVDAGMILDMMGNLIVCQIVNPMKTVRIEVPKWIIEEIVNSYDL